MEYREYKGYTIWRKTATKWVVFDCEGNCLRHCNTLREAKRRIDNQSITTRPYHSTLDLAREVAFAEIYD